MPSTVEILKGWRELIAAPDRWTKWEFARFKNGDPCHYENLHAQCFCVLGALGKAAGHADFTVEAKHKLYAALRITGNDGAISIAAFNDRDETQHTDVLTVLDKAIELASAEAQPQ